MVKIKLTFLPFSRSAMSLLRYTDDEIEEMAQYDEKLPEKFRRRKYRNLFEATIKEYGKELFQEIKMMYSDITTFFYKISEKEKGR